MGCRFCDFDGKCDNWDPEFMFEHIVTSCDNKGHCMVEDDPDPLFSCEDYQEE